MQTISQNPYAAPSTTGTTEAAQLGILSSLFFFGKATLFQKMSFAFISSLLFTSLFIQVIRRLKFKEKMGSYPWSDLFIVALLVPLLKRLPFVLTLLNL